MNESRRFYLSVAATKVLASAANNDTTLGRALCLLFKDQILGEKFIIARESPEVGILMHVLSLHPYPSPRQKENKQESSPQTPCKEINKEKTQIPPEPYISIKRAERFFERFWQVYPRKVGKEAAKRKFLNLLHRLTETQAFILVKKMLDAIEVQSQSKQWSDSTFIPHPTTWLNQGRWEDESATPKRSQADIERELAASYF